MGRDDGLLGAFEEQVLLAVVHLGADAYGMSVRREIEARTGREVSMGAVYATLDRMEAKGWVTFRVEQGDETRGGRARKMVGVTEDGGDALRGAAEMRARMWGDVAPGDLPEARNA